MTSMVEQQQQRGVFSMQQQQSHTPQQQQHQTALHDQTQSMYPQFGTAGQAQFGQYNKEALMKNYAASMSAMAYWPGFDYSQLTSHLASQTLQQQQQQQQAAQQQQQQSQMPPTMQQYTGQTQLFPDMCQQQQQQQQAQTSDSGAALSPACDETQSVVAPASPDENAAVVDTTHSTDNSEQSIELKLDHSATNTSGNQSQISPSTPSLHGTHSSPMMPTMSALPFGQHQLTSTPHASAAATALIGGANIGTMPTASNTAAATVPSCSSAAGASVSNSSSNAAAAAFASAAGGSPFSFGMAAPSMAVGQMNPLTSSFDLMHNSFGSGGGGGPMMRKKRANPVPPQLKDETYWDRRRRNNESARRSRESRRQKEDQIAMRVVYLEQENLQLRTEVSMIRAECEKMRILLYNSGVTSQ